MHERVNKLGGEPTLLTSVELSRREHDHPEPALERAFAFFAPQEHADPHCVRDVISICVPQVFSLLWNAVPSQASLTSQRSAHEHGQHLQTHDAQIRPTPPPVRLCILLPQLREDALAIASAV